MFNKANAKMLVDSTIVNTIYENLLKIFIVFHIIKFTFIIPDILNYFTCYLVDR